MALQQRSLAPALRLTKVSHIDIRKKFFYELGGRVILCTAKDKADRIHERAEADIGLASGIAFGACRLPNDAGLTSKCWAAGPRK